MYGLNVGSIPVVADHQSRSLVGMIPDRDMCRRVLAHGLPSRRRSQEFVTYNLPSAAMVRMSAIASPAGCLLISVSPFAEEIPLSMQGFFPLHFAPRFP